VPRRRVDQLGVAGPTLQRSGDRRVIVELPGVYDPKQAVEVIGRTAQLAFHPVLGVFESAPGAPTTTTPAGEDELAARNWTVTIPASATGALERAGFQ
jgi:SecD/SecF fusion protein